jgi:hypothetical protein
VTAEKKARGKAPTVGAHKPVRNPMDPQSHYSNDERALLRFDPGWAKCSLALRTGTRFGHGAEELNCLSWQRVWGQLEVRRTRLLRGDTLEILHAIALCAQEDLPLPTWLANAFREGFSSFTRPGGPPSLDALFHSALLPTNTHKRAERARQDWRLGGQLYKEVWGVAKKHTAMDSALDEVLGAKKWGVKKTTARRLVEMVEATHCQLTGIETLSRFWAKRRKLMRQK